MEMEKRGWMTWVCIASTLLGALPAQARKQPRQKDKTLPKSEAIEEDTKTDPAPSPRVVKSVKVQREEIERVFSRFRHEPLVEDVQKAAVRFAMASASRVRSLRRRVRLAALLPEVKVGMEKTTKADASIKIEVGESNRLSQDEDAALSLGVQLRWSLDRLIFDPNELKVSQQANRLVEIREEVIDHATRLYFERRRLQVLRIISPPRSVRAAVLGALALQRVTAALDGVTGGWFSRRLKRSHRRSASPKPGIHRP